MAEFVTQAEFARQLGVERAYVTKLKKNGLLVMKGKKVDVEASKKLIEDNSDPARAQEKKGKGKKRAITFSDARTLKEAARARLVQIQVKEKEGELVNAAEVERELIDLFTTIKTRIRAIAPKTAQEITHLKTGKKSKRDLIAAVRDIISKECDEALQGISEWKQ